MHRASCYHVVMYIDRVPNRNSPPAILLRESYREGHRVRKRTLANLSALPEHAIHAVERSLKGERLVSTEDAFEIVRSLPHGHVAAVVGTMNRLGLPELLSTKRHRNRQLVLAMIAARILDPSSKLATAQRLGSGTLSSSLGQVLEVQGADADDLYGALDWLCRGQTRIEKKLADRHLREGDRVLWDATKLPFESLTCELAAFGRPDARRKSQRQVLFGLMATAEGIPVAVEVFAGNTGDPNTVGPALDRVQKRFGLNKVIMVGDRGMITDAQIKQELRPRGVGWITSLRAPTIRKLSKGGGPLQLSLFDEQDLAEVTHPDFPDERFVACRNPLLAEDRRRTRQALLAATEKKLAQVRARTQRVRSPLRGAKEIGVEVGKVLGASKVAKHFRYEITEDAFTFERDPASIEAEAALDGIYVIRTSVPAEVLEAEKVVQAYKDLSAVEQSFRVMKTSALQVGPIRHRLEAAGAGARLPLHAGPLRTLAHGEGAGPHAPDRPRPRGRSSPTHLRRGSGRALRSRGAEGPKPKDGGWTARPELRDASGGPPHSHQESDPHRGHRGYLSPIQPPDPPPRKRLRLARRRLSDVASTPYLTNQRNVAQPRHKSLDRLRGNFRLS